MDIHEKVIITCARCGRQERVLKRDSGFWFAVKYGDVCRRCANELEASHGYIRHEWHSDEHGFTRVMGPKPRKPVTTSGT